MYYRFMYSIVTLIFVDSATGTWQNQELSAIANFQPIESQNLSLQTLIQWKARN